MALLDVADPVEFEEADEEADEEAVAAQVADCGRPVTPCPAHRLSANFIVATLWLGDSLCDVSGFDTYLSGLPRYTPWTRNRRGVRVRACCCRYTARLFVDIHRVR